MVQLPRPIQPAWGLAAPVPNGSVFHESRASGEEPAAGRWQRGQQGREFLTKGLCFPLASNTVTTTCCPAVFNILSQPNLSRATTLHHRLLHLVLLTKGQIQEDTQAPQPQVEADRPGLLRHKFGNFSFILFPCHACGITTLAYSLPKSTRRGGWQTKARTSHGATALN